ncbi:cupin domain-containing protein [Thalassotalea sp. PS06]|nr:cupin domain-containing protein [Thalassotalea sp. PS06]
MTIERIVSTGQSSPDEGWYEQSQDEWVLVVRGNAVLGFENELALSAGDYVLISSMVRHKVISASGNPETIWLVIHIQGEVQV